jgi:Short C-terminal domain
MSDRGSAKTHGLGMGNGGMIEYDDGTVGYRKTGSFSQAFRVKIADVTGFSVTKGDKMLERTINVLGNGTLLGSASVNHGTAEKIESWFRAQPEFGQTTQPAPAQTPSMDLTEQLTKLAALKDQGALTEDEFQAAKARLLS